MRHATSFSVRLCRSSPCCSFALTGCGAIGGSAPKECIPVQYFCVQPEEFNKAAATAAKEFQDDPSFQKQWELAYVKADEAYGNLSVLKGPGAEPGAGVTIGIMHAGIDLDHPAFAGKNVTEIFLDGAEDETGEESASYGTAVASVAAGRRFAEGEPGYEIASHGVAWGADIAMFAIPTSRVTGARARPARDPWPPRTRGMPRGMSRSCLGVTATGRWTS